MVILTIHQFRRLLGCCTSAFLSHHDNNYVLWMCCRMLLHTSPSLHAAAQSLM